MDGDEDSREYRERENKVVSKIIPCHKYITWNIIPKQGAKHVQSLLTSYSLTSWREERRVK